MGVDCSCIRIDLLEEKTIMSGDLFQEKQKQQNLKLSEIIENSEKFENSETLENIDPCSSIHITSLSRKYLQKKLFSNPLNFYQLCSNHITFYIPQTIKETESLLNSIHLDLPPEVYNLTNYEYFQGSFDELLRKTGFGIQLLNEEMYSGNFVKGRREGFGRIIKTDRSVYQGTFLNGVLEGEGICMEEGIVFKGEFKKGKKFGVGREEWPDKSVYYGEYFNNAKHGKGKFV